MRVLGGLALALPLLVAADCMAQEGAPGQAPSAQQIAAREASPSTGRDVAEQVSVKFTVCRVASRPGPVDEACGALQKHLHVSFGTMVLRDETTSLVDFGEPAKLTLGESSMLEVIPITVLGPRLHMQVQVPGAVSARMQILLGRTTILVGELGGEQLVIGVRPAFEPEYLDAEQDPSAIPPSQRPRRRLPEARQAGARGGR